MSTATASGITSNSSGIHSPPTTTTTNTTTNTTTTPTSTTAKSKSSSTVATSTHQSSGTSSSSSSISNSRRSSRSAKKQQQQQSSSSKSTTTSASSHQKQSKQQQQQQQQQHGGEGSGESPTKDGFPYTSAVPQMAQTLLSEFNKLSEARTSNQAEQKQLLRERPDWSNQRNEAYVTAFNLNVDVHMEAEMGNRLALILAKAINMLTDEQQRQHFSQLMQDARTVGFSDINHRIADIRNERGTRYFHVDIESGDDQVILNPGPDSAAGSITPSVTTLPNPVTTLPNPVTTLPNSAATVSATGTTDEKLPQQQPVQSRKRTSHQQNQPPRQSGSEEPSSLMVSEDDDEDLVHLDEEGDQLDRMEEDPPASEDQTASTLT